MKKAVAVAGMTGLFLASTGVAGADEITNNVGGSGAVVTVAAGTTTVVAMRVKPTSTPAGDPTGCDADGGSLKTTITVSSASGYTNLKLKGQGPATGAPVSFDATNCHQSKKFQFIVAAGTPGGTSWSIHAVGSDGIAGSSYISSGDFTLRVSATAAATSLALAPGAVSIVYGTASQTWTATLTAAGTGLAGKTINFSVGGTPLTATTNASGVATLVAPIGTTYSADPLAYDIDAAFDGETNYASSFATGTFTIIKAGQAAMAITAPTSGGFGQTLPISFSGGSGTGLVSFGASGACSLTPSGDSVHIDSGTGTCTVTGAKAGDTNYNNVIATPRSFAVGQASQSALSITSPNTGTYGDLLAITTTGGSGSGAVTFDAGTSSACAIESGQLRITSGTGTCAITATKAADSDYSATTSASHPVTIGKAARTLSITGPDHGTYGQSYVITYTSSAGTGAVTFDAGSSAACQIVGNQVHITSGTGSCDLTGTQAADSDFAEATSAPFSVTPDKAVASILLSDLTATYDGGGHTATATTSPAGLSGVTITYDGSTTAPIHAGSYAVVASLSNADYAAPEAHGTLVISPKTLTGAITADNKEYDGTTDAVVHAVPLSGLVGSDVVALEVANGAFDDASAGTDKTVTADISLSGADAADYALAADTASTTAAIGKRTVTGTVTAADKPYDRTTLASATPVGLDRALPGDGVSLVVDSATFDGANAGPHTVTANLSLSGADAANYQLTSTTATAPATITPIGLTAIVTADSKPYDGTSSATAHPTLGVGVISPDDVTVVVSSATFSDENAGTGKTVTVILTLDGADAGNYALSSLTYYPKANIDRLGVTGAFTSTDKVYDGSTTAAVVTTDVIGEIPGDAVTLNLTGAVFSSKNVGTRTVTASGPTLGGADAGNYSLTSVATTTADITPAYLTPTLVPAAKPYDGTATATATVTLGGVIGSEGVTASASSATFDNPNAGTGKLVTGTVTLGGADAGNYELAGTNPYTASNGVINQVSLSVTASSAFVTLGAAVPTITPIYAGFVNGEGPGALTTAPTCTTSYTPASPVGSYPTSCTGLVAQNYAPAYHTGLVTVSYAWSGFFQPIDAAPNNSNGKDSAFIGGSIYNKVKAGSTVPVKFSLGGDQGLAILASGYPTSTQVTCSGTANVDAVEEVTSNPSGLKYDAAAGQYTYSWKTSSSGWAGTCRELQVKLADGTSHYAFFQFTK